MLHVRKLHMYDYTSDLIGKILNIMDTDCNIYNNFYTPVNYYTSKLRNKEFMVIAYRLHIFFYKNDIYSHFHTLL